MKILGYTQVWKRADLTRLSIRSVQKIGLEVVAVISEEEMINLCEDLGVRYVMCENRPLGRKHNVGMNEALKYDWDYLLMFGSDDIVSPKLLDLYKPYLEKGVDFFGLGDVWFYEPATGRMMQYGYQNKQPSVSFGAGRMTSRKFVSSFQKNGVVSLWTDTKEKCLDSDSTANATRKGWNHVVVRSGDPLVVDIKTNVNIWGFDNYSGQQKSISDLSGFFGEEILQDLTNFKSLKSTKHEDMKNTKRATYRFLGRTYHCMKLNVNGEEVKVEFTNGMQNSEGEGITGATFTTSDQGIIDKIESHPLFRKKIILEKKRDLTIKEQGLEEKEVKDSVAEEEILDKEEVAKEVTVVEGVGTVQEAIHYLKQNHPDVKTSYINTLAKLAAWLKEDGRFQFPNLIDPESL